MTGRQDGRTDVLRSAFLWGSLWGIWEATAGYVFHLVPAPGLAGLMMFPAGFFFMSRAFAASGKSVSIFLAAGTASSIKLFDLFLPGRSVLSVINPAQAILLESLAVIGIFSFLNKAGRISLSVPLLASVAWRVTYAVLSIFAARAFAAPNLFETGILAVFRFILVDGVSNGLLVAIMIWAERSRWQALREYSYE